MPCLDTSSASLTREGTSAVAARPYREFRKSALFFAQPLFGFAESTSFRTADLFWSALLGLICGLVAMVFTITFRKFRAFAVHAPIPHTRKLVIGGLLTGICGLIFVIAYPGELIPLGPNYEAVRQVLTQRIPPANYWCSHS